MQVLNMPAHSTTYMKQMVFYKAVHVLKRTTVFDKLRKAVLQQHKTLTVGAGAL